jgi:glycosyltransferase involved in cell wall biosynthesis
MNHDVIDDRYARLFEIPDRLGQRLSVYSFCLDYRLQKKGPISADLKDNWFRFNIPRTIFVGWFFALMLRARKIGPQCVVASSDCVHVILGAFLSRFLGATFFVDLYDDYSTFGLAKIPGMHWLYMRALAHADGISVVSRTLEQLIEKQFPGKPVLLMESTIDADLFYPRDKSESRKALGLNRFEGKKLVGVCGGLNASHGADIIFAAFSPILALNPDVVFVVAGRLCAECPLPELENIEYLGTLPHTQMPQFFSALDVAIVGLSNTRFGRYAFPQKAYEVIACRVPVAAANVGALSMLFSDLESAQYDADSPQSLAKTVVHQLETGSVLRVDIPTWDDQAERLSGFIQALKAH